MLSLPNQAGTYVLRLKLPGPARLVIGRLGEFDFPSGNYLYLGSAFGPGGLAGRLTHHLSEVKRPHWHIDHFRQVANVFEVCYAAGLPSLECQWSQRVANLPGVEVPAPGFGASDCPCGCAAHLYFIPRQVDSTLIGAILHECGDNWVYLPKIE